MLPKSESNESEKSPHAFVQESKDQGAAPSHGFPQYSIKTGTNVLTCLFLINPHFALCRSPPMI